MDSTSDLLERIDLLLGQCRSIRYMTALDGGGAAALTATSPARGPEPGRRNVHTALGAMAETDAMLGDRLERLAAVCDTVEQSLASILTPLPPTPPTATPPATGEVFAREPEPLASDLTANLYRHADTQHVFARRADEIGDRLLRLVERVEA